MDDSLRAQWEEFCTKVIAPVCAQFRQLLEVDDPEETPYKSRYAAAKLLKEEALAKLVGFQDQHDVLNYELDGRSMSFATIRGALYSRRARALADTDLVQEAHSDFKQAIEQLSVDRPYQDAFSLLRSLSGVAAIEANWEDVDAALRHLREAEKVYDAVDAGDATVHAGLDVYKEADVKAVWEDTFTECIVLSAQMYQQHKDDPSGAASICALALQRQVKFNLQASSGSARVPYQEWIINGLGLAVFYFERQEFAVAEHLLNACNAVLEMAQAREGVEVDEGTVGELEMSWGRYYLARLTESAKGMDPDEPGSFLPGMDPAEGPRDPEAPSGLTDLPESLRFEVLGLPEVSKLPWGEAACARDLQGAMDLFNKCVRQLREALKKNPLDGAVTDHIMLLFNVSQAYSSLAVFEADAHTRCVMHRARVKQFEAVEGDKLSRQHYEGLVKSVALETANAVNDIWLVKNSNGWPLPKVMSAFKEADKRFGAFLDLFRSPDGKLPDKLDEDWEEPLMQAAVRYSSMLIRMQSPAVRDQLLKAEALLKWALDYVQRNNVHDVQRKKALYDELHGLVVQKLTFMGV